MCPFIRVLSTLDKSVAILQGDNICDFLLASWCTKPPLKGSVLKGKNLLPGKTPFSEGNKTNLTELLPCPPPPQSINLRLCLYKGQIWHKMMLNTLNPSPAEPRYVLPLQTVQIQISWLLPTDLDLHCLTLSMCEFISTIWIK